MLKSGKTIKASGKIKERLKKYIKLISKAEKSHYTNDICS